MNAAGRIVVEGGEATGEALVLTAPISFWGGVDPKTGAIVDVRHPEFGENIADKVLFIPASIGSSTASTILLELVHAGHGPAALVLHEVDAILLLGLIAAREIGLDTPPALTLDRDQHARFSRTTVTVGFDGGLSAVSGS